MPIDRKALVSRHDPILTGLDPFSPLSVGNGEFAFSADATGLQTFAPSPGGATPLCAMAQWGWHSYALSPGEIRDRARLRLEEFDADGRGVGYMSASSGQEELFSALRVNPHRLNLARVSLVREGGLLSRGPAPYSPCFRRRKTASLAEPLPSEISSVVQKLNLWEGLLESSFVIGEEAVGVWTVVHPDRDILSFRIQSAALESGALALRLSFPYGSHSIDASDWNSPEKHETKILPAGCRSAAPAGQDLFLERVLDGDRYFVAIRMGLGCSIEREGRHAFILRGAGRVLEVSLEFSPLATAVAIPSWEECRSAAASRWAQFWESGGAVDLEGSADPRAFELERRIVLSQYLTAIQCAGNLPPQETGLTCNSWYGKFHLEMHYWHAAHFVQWGRPLMLERSLGWYRSTLDSARARAAAQGYRGARWPKMTDPSGEDSPSPIGPLLCWQQPHPIMYAELLRRAGLGAEALAPFAELVFESAEFMADYVLEESPGGRFVLGPPLIPAQECHAPMDSLNPPFELEYWRWGLETAIAWNGRFGAARSASGSASEAAGAAVEAVDRAARWGAVLARLASPVAVPSRAGEMVYLAHERCPDTFGRFAIDHPSMLFALGMLPGRSVDRAIMSNTFDEVQKSWDFDTCWGWDFPATAMTAARLGRPRDAIEALLMDTPKNSYRPNGHNAQGQDALLPLYLPGNGALLLAVGMMAGGWDGSPDRAAPGFPDDSSWKVHAEGIARLP
ncbi:MAG TPA: hypothetical protein VN445_06750 [Rectinemataceae bacterium]|nr:hypothetical protein [Rectinemataceae bacterium]